MRSGALLAALIASPLLAAKPAAGPLLLDRAAFDPALVLPPPPADGSREALDELETLRAIGRERTPAERAQAEADSKAKDVTIFAQAMGPGFQLDRLPATQTLFATVRREEKAAADRAKDVFRRDRPWMADRSLHPCSTNDAPGSS